MRADYGRPAVRGSVRHKLLSIADAVVQVRDFAVVRIEERVGKFGRVCVCVGGEWKHGATFVNGVNNGLRCVESNWMVVVNPDGQLHDVRARGTVPFIPPVPVKQT